MTDMEFWLQSISIPKLFFMKNYQYRDLNSTLSRLSFLFITSGLLVFSSCNTQEQQAEKQAEVVQPDQETKNGADNVNPDSATVSVEPKTETTEVTLDKIYTKTQEESKFPGGATAWAQFLNTTFKYPQKAVDAEVQGTVVVQFIVDTEGNVRDVKALSGPALLADESVKLIKSSGRWIPARQDGQAVNSYKKQPIVFRLESEG